ncbi:MAG: ABC transporter ATP-binding protein [Verrucomicrobiota bacterium]|nr:ABC transporter ATP-binding protein [Verrucomicrobiota bacterium]
MNEAAPASIPWLSVEEEALRPVLSADGLGVGFYTDSGKRLDVVQDVSFALYSGRMTALVGESGCGKSITALALGGLLPRGMKMDRGRMKLDASASAASVRPLAYVFQDPGACLDPVFTIGSQIREVLPRVERAQAAVRMRTLLQTVGFEQPDRVLASYPHQLSGGMQQRAMLAMALAGRPRVLVADEPTTALDVTVQAKILALLTELQRKENLAVLLITHNLGVVAEAADDLLVMYAGRVVERGPVGLLKKPCHPYVEGLLKALPRVEGNAGRLEGIGGWVPPLGRRPPGCAFHPRCSLARAICAEVVPEEAETSPGHAVACHACRAREGWK